MLLNLYMIKSPFVWSKQFLVDIANNILSSNILDNKVLSLVSLPLDRESKSCIYSCACRRPLPMGSKIRHQIVISYSSERVLNRRNAFKAMNWYWFIEAFEREYSMPKAFRIRSKTSWFKRRWKIEFWRNIDKGTRYLFGILAWTRGFSFCKFTSSCSMAFAVMKTD